METPPEPEDIKPEIERLIAIGSLRNLAAPWTSLSSHLWTYLKKTERGMTWQRVEQAVSDNRYAFADWATDKCSWESACNKLGEDLGRP